jgi:hypothetical protein
MPSFTKARLRSLESGFTAEVDDHAEAPWCELLVNFDDASIYQSWSYDEVRCGRESISHLVLRHDGEIVAAAQARLKLIPVLGAGIAYVRWGPMWRRRGRVPPVDVFRQAIRAVRNEYVGRRGLTARIYPAVFREDDTGYTRVLNEEGFFSVVGTTDRTLLLDLSQSLADLRKSLRQHWSRYLKVAEKNNLEVLEGTDDDLFELFIPMYREMIGRKRFAEPNDINEFRAIQKALPHDLKMRISICKSGGEVCAGHIVSAIGNIGVYLFGATSDKGLNSRGSYLLHWRAIEWLKSRGFEWYDLNGINPITNPGTYKFKSDLCGHNGKDVHFLGRFEARGSVLSHSSVACGDRLRTVYHRVRQLTKV